MLDFMMVMESFYLLPKIKRIILVANNLLTNTRYPYDDNNVGIL